MLGAASSTATEGGVAMTERQYKVAAELFASAADYLPAGHVSEHGGYLTQEAQALYQQGDERFDNDALRGCIEIYGSALADYPRSRVPLSWASIKMGLGSALSMLGERESGTAHLKDGVAAFREALEEYTRSRLPLYEASA
jgi:tetratricopeptide (TPR) repeat protein